MARPSSKQQQSKHATLSDTLNKALGLGSARLSSTTQPREYISTGCLSLDLALGGGWARGAMHGIFGPRDIGKSTIIGLSAVREAQKAGLTCGWVAVEPGFDPEWARKHGVDPDNLFLLEPDTGEQAFEGLYTMVMHDEDPFDLIVFDSIGALLAETEISGKTGNDGKMKAGGQAGLITWGVKRIIMPISKRKQTVLMLNQVRENMGSHMAGFKQPGGHALEHSELSIVQLKHGKDRYMIKEHGAEIQVGQQVVAIVLRNKANEGSRQRAVFDFYNKETEDYPFGIDVIGDLINTGKRVGVIRQGGAYYYLPGNEKGFYKKDMGEYFDKNPEILESIKQDILTALQKKKVDGA